MAIDVAGNRVVEVRSGSFSGVYPRTEALTGDWGIAYLAEPSYLVGAVLKDNAIVGSAQHADVRIDCTSVEQEHARFHVRADGVYVEDLGSRHGTWVDGVLAGRIGLGHGSVVRFGQALGVFVECGLNEMCGHYDKLSDLSLGPKQRSWFDLAVGHVRARRSFLIEGGPGVGKRTLAEAALAAAGMDRDVIVVDGRAPNARSQVSDALASRPMGLVVLHMDEFDRAAQVETVRVIRKAPGALLVATLARRLEQAIADGALAPVVVSSVGGRRVTVPDIEERREDIAAVLEVHCKRKGIDCSLLTVGVVEQLLRAGWPGGFRQMFEVLDEVSRNDLTEREKVSLIRQRASRPSMRVPLSLHEVAPDLAKARLLRALEVAQGTVAIAARDLRMSRQALYREMKKLGVDLPRRIGEG